MLAATVSNEPNSNFFSICETANFWMSVAQKPAAKSHTSPGKKFEELKKSFTLFHNLCLQSKCGHHKQKKSLFL